MRRSRLAGPMLAAAFTISYLGMAGAANAGGYVETDLVIGGPDVDHATKPPTLTDKNGIKHQAPFDKNLVNPWGIAASGTSPFWISDNNAGVSTLYDAQGNPRSLVVSIPLPPPNDPLQPGGTPTGAVFNIAQGAGAFPIPGFSPPNCNMRTTAPATFLFATEDGTIVGWNPNLYPTMTLCNAGGPQTHGIIRIDHSNNGKGAVYKGLAIATTEFGGATFLYAANFRAGRVEIYGPNFELLFVFTDLALLRDGYAPFNIVPIRMKNEDADTLVVTFAKPKLPDRHDDQAGPGNGFVDMFDLFGFERHRFASHGDLNSPWGVALAPSDFGDLSGALLIGNFGDGRINAFDPDSGMSLGKVKDNNGQPIVIEGLWAIKFGTDNPNEGTHNTLFFTAGVNDESDGLFGKLSPLR